MSKLKIQVLIDNKRSWMVPYAKDLVKTLQDKNYDVNLLHEHKEVSKGDILCLLSCERIFKNLNLNKHNIVVHASSLPKGKGWSPVTWQILEGKNKIPVTLFEAVEAIDAGNIYAQEFINLNGTELLYEIKNKQGIITNKLILNFIDQYPNVVGREQEGTSSFYSKREPNHSELNPNKNLASQFNLLRVCDNERYPAFFKWKGKKYIIKIYSEDDQ